MEFSIVTYRSYTLFPKSKTKNRFSVKWIIFGNICDLFDEIFPQHWIIEYEKGLSIMLTRLLHSLDFIYLDMIKNMSIVKEFRTSNIWNNEFKKQWHQSWLSVGWVGIWHGSLQRYPRDAHSTDKQENIIWSVFLFIRV